MSGSEGGGKTDERSFILKSQEVIHCDCPGGHLLLSENEKDCELVCWLSGKWETKPTLRLQSPQDPCQARTKNQADQDRQDGQDDSDQYPGGDKPAAEHETVTESQSSLHCLPSSLSPSPGGDSVPQ